MATIVVAMLKERLVMQEKEVEMPMNMLIEEKDPGDAVSIDNMEGKMNELLSA